MCSISENLRVTAFYTAFLTLLQCLSLLQPKPQWCEYWVASPLVLKSWLSYAVHLPK